MLIAHIRYIVILTRLLGFLIIFLYLLFVVLRSLQRIARQWSREKFAILTLKPWPVVTQNTCYAENKYKIYTLARPPRAERSLKRFL